MIRVVKLTMATENIESFTRFFEGIKQKIRASEGCLSLKALQDRSDPRIFMTYSEWADPIDLQNYRRSELFKTVWRTVRPLFEAKPEAWSLDVLAEL